MVWGWGVVQCMHLVLIYFAPAMVTYICIFPTNVLSTLMGRAQIDR